MTIRTSGPISLGDIQAEFGGSAGPINLGSYYAGGGLVSNPAPTSNVQTGIVPTSGPISIGSFYGLAAFAVGLPSPGTYTSNREQTTSAGLGITLLSNGGFSIGDSDQFETLLSGNWGAPTTAGVGAAYWVKFTLTNSTIGGGSGTISPSTGWLNLGTSRNVGVTAQSTSNPRVPVSASRGATYLIQIASDAGGNSILASANYTIQLSITFDPNA